MPAIAAPPLPRRVTAGQLAKLLGVTERMILGRTSDGRLPKTGEGHIDLCAIVQAGVVSLAVRSQQDDAPGLEHEKTRLAREQADQLAMKNAAMRGELVPLVEVRTAVITMIETTKKHLTRVPAKAFPSDVPSRKVVANAIEAALIDLSAERAVPTTPAAG